MPEQCGHVALKEFLRCEIEVNQMAQGVFQHLAAMDKIDANQIGIDTCQSSLYAKECGFSSVKHGELALVNSACIVQAASGGSIGMADGSAVTVNPATIISVPTG